MPLQALTVGALQGRTTEVNGRYEIVGPGYSFIADSPLRGGGPGEAIGTLDLLVASLVVCALNILRKDDPADPNEPSALVECYAAVHRSEADGARLGELELRFVVNGIEDRAIRERAFRFHEFCRIYRAVRDSLVVRFIVNGAEIHQPKLTAARPFRRPLRVEGAIPCF